MNQEVQRLRKEGVRAVDSDDIPVAAWRRVGERELFNQTVKHSFGE